MNRTDDIIDLQSIRDTRQVPRRPTVYRVIGVHIADRAAVVTVERTGSRVRVVDIDRPRSDLRDVARVLDRLERRPSDLLVIDTGQGAGTALHEYLGRPSKGVQLEAATGRARQRLIDSLLLAMSTRSIEPAGDLAERDALIDALKSFRRHVGDDGTLGSEIVVALALAVAHKRPGPPRIY